MQLLQRKIGENCRCGMDGVDRNNNIADNIAVADRSLKPCLDVFTNWIIDMGGFAKKVKNTSLSLADQIKDCGAYRECPNCSYRIDNSDVFPEWPGLPAGVKFDPSDAELLEHLAAKCGSGNSQPHRFINEFIPTLEGDHGICYTHPENLPGAKKDGSSVHFFHRTSNAYATGQRKRRKILDQHAMTEDHVRWHKTGKTKPVIEDGIQKGCKKIMVLYKRSAKGSKSYKSNWVMHQYHLGTEEDEKDGEYVVSKIFYQQLKQPEKDQENLMVDDADTVELRTRSPKTPNPTNPPRPGKAVVRNDILDENILPSFTRDSKSIPEGSNVPPSNTEDEVNAEYPACLAGESQAVDNSDFDGLDNILLCDEILDPSAFINDSGLNASTSNDITNKTNELAKNNIPYGLSDLENMYFDTPPDFQLSNLQFSSQDSVFDWIDKL